MAIELYKVAHNLAPKIMHLVFKIKSNPLYYPREKTSNIRTVRWGTEFFIGPKIWLIISSKIEKLLFPQFKKYICNWRSDKCPYRLFVPNNGLPRNNLQRDNLSP